jgi:nuclear pore complex protein Nup205
MCRILTMYDVKEEDYEGVVDQSRLSTTKETSSLQTQLPVLELLKVCFCNILVQDFEGC